MDSLKTHHVVLPTATLNGDPDCRRCVRNTLARMVNSNATGTPQVAPKRRLDLSIWAPIVRRLGRGWIRRVSTVAKRGSRTNTRRKHRLVQKYALGAPSFIAEG